MQKSQRDKILDEIIKERLEQKKETTEGSDINRETAKRYLQPCGKIKGKPKSFGEGHIISCLGVEYGWCNHKTHKK